MSVQPSPSQSVTTTPGAPVSAVLAPDGVITLAMADGAGVVHVASSNRFYASGESAQGWGFGWFNLRPDPITVPGAPISSVVGPDGTYTLCMADVTGAVWSASAESAGALNSWSSVSPQSGIRTTPGAPVSAVMAEDGSITVFLADGAGDLWSATSAPYEAPGDANPVWGAWTAVAPQARITTTPGAPVTAVAGPDGSITLFVADSGGTVWAAGGNSTDGWGHWTPVSPHTGTTTPGALVTAVLAPEGTFTMFMADAAGEVRTTSGDVDGGWGRPWTSVSQSSTEPGAPVNAVLAGDGTFTVFLADRGGGVFAASGSQAGGWGDWTPLSAQTGNTAPGASVTAVLALDGIITVCMAAASGEVRTASGNATQGWTPWRTVSPGSAPLGAPVTAVAAPDGMYTLFIADQGGVVHATSSNPSVAPGSPGPAWGAWTSLPPDVITTPGAPLSAVVAPDGVITVFVADRTGGVWAASGNPARGWGDRWSSVAQGSTAPGAPVTAVVAPDGLITVFLADPGGSVFTASGSPAGGWGEWWPVSPQTGTTTPGAPVTALLAASGLFTLFMADTGGQVHAISGNSTEGWGGGWSSVAQGITTPGAPVTAMVAPGGLFALFLANSDGSVLAASGSPAGGWGVWSSVSPQTGTTTPGAPVTAVLSADGIFTLFVANHIGEVLTVWGSPTDEWVGWTLVSAENGNTTPGAPVTAMVEGTISGGILPDGIVRLFLVNPTGDVLTASGNPALGWGPGWSSVSTQADATTPDAALTAVVGPGGIITLFMADPGGGVYTASGNLCTASGTAGPGWGTWSSVSQGSTAPGAPITAVVAPDAIVTVFVADPGGSVFTASGSPVGGWGDWTPVSPQTATTLPGAPLSACLAADGTITVFMADASGEVRTASGNAADGWGSGWSSVSQGATLPGAPVCAVPGPGGIFTLFLADPGGGVFTASGSRADGWSGWAPVSPQTGTTTPGAPIAAVLRPNGIFTVFMVDPVGGEVRAASGNRDQGWGGGWGTSAIGFTTPGALVTAVSLGPGEIMVFGVDPEGSVWSTSGNHSQGWPDLTNVTPGGTTTPGATVIAAPGPDGMITLFLPIPGYVTLGWGSTLPAAA